MRRLDTRQPAGLRPVHAVAAGSAGARSCCAGLRLDAIPPVTQVDQVPTSGAGRTDAASPGKRTPSPQSGIARRHRPVADRGKTSE
ncbi:hypothetical protein D3C80_1532190 [compost metagenome]